MQLDQPQSLDDVFAAADDVEQSLTAQVQKVIQAELLNTSSLFLSKLGQKLGSDTILKIKTATKGQALGVFVKERLGHLYELKEYPGPSPTVWLINSQKIREDEAGKFPNTPVEFRFNRRFWAAFSVPLPAGQRVMNCENFTFEDVLEDTQKSSDMCIIKPSDVPSPEEENRKEIIIANIGRWLEQMGWQKERVAAFRTPRLTAKPISQTAPKSLLHAVIEALDKRQLQNQMLSLDVVSTLLNQSV